jgi:hypothetical protein
VGFQRKRKVYKLDFTGTEYEGLEVRVSGLTTGEYLDFLGGNVDEEDGASTDAMLQMFARHLVSWNLEDEGVPVPATFEGLKTNDMPMNMLMIDAWTSALANVPESTAKKLNTGSDPLVASIPTEML